MPTSRHDHVIAKPPREIRLVLGVPLTSIYLMSAASWWVNPSGWEVLALGCGIPTFFAFWVLGRSLQLRDGQLTHRVCFRSVFEVPINCIRKVKVSYTLPNTAKSRPDRMYLECELDDETQSYEIVLSSFATADIKAVGSAIEAAIHDRGESTCPSP